MTQKSRIAGVLTAASLAFTAVACSPPQQDIPVPAPASAPALMPEYSSPPVMEQAQPVALNSADANRAFRSEAIALLKNNGDWESFDCFRMLNDFAEGPDTAPDKDCPTNGLYGVVKRGSVTTYYLNGEPSAAKLQNFTANGYNENLIRLGTGAHEFGHHLNTISGKHYVTGQDEFSAHLFSLGIVFRADPEEALAMQKGISILGPGHEFSGKLQSADLARLTRNGASIEAIYNETSIMVADILGKPAPVRYQYAAQAAETPALTPASPPPAVQRVATAQTSEASRPQAGGVVIQIAAPQKRVIETPRM